MPDSVVFPWGCGRLACCEGALGCADFSHPVASGRRRFQRIPATKTCTDLDNFHIQKLRSAATSASGALIQSGIVWLPTISCA